MTKEFTPYELALDLKELGFDEECLSAFFDDKIKRCDYVQNSKSNYLSAPLYQQVFRWFREKHNLTWEHQFDDSNISLYVGEITYPDNNLEFFKNIEVDYNGYNKAYEEAELECLQKLIQIVKNK